MSTEEKEEVRVRGKQGFTDNHGTCIRCIRTVYITLSLNWCLHTHMQLLQFWMFALQAGPIYSIPPD